MLKRTLLVVSLAALPGAAEARDVIQPSTVSRSATVAGGAARTLQVSCPTPAVALNATAIFQAGARSVAAMIDVLGALHTKIRGEVG